MSIICVHSMLYPSYADLTVADRFIATDGHEHLPESANEVFEVLCYAFDEFSFCRTRVTKWHGPFKASRVSGQDDETS